MDSIYQDIPRLYTALAEWLACVIYVEILGKNRKHWKTWLIGGDLGYFISYEFGSFLAQCINFPLQRNITFKSHGNPVYQAMWYFIAWILISLICNGFNNLWMPIAAEYVAPAIYNILVTFITGGVSMIIFFFVFKIIFPEGEAKK